MITSFGIIVYTIQDNEKYFLIGKRSDSLEYLDMFNNRCPIEKVGMYVKMCTLFERKKLLRNDFDLIYYDSFSEYREYNDVYKRWLKIKDIVFKTFEEGGLIDSERPMYVIPKGRKKVNEYPEQAAIREFQEETRIDIKNMQKVFYPPYIDKYIGSDDKSYKTVYFLYKTDKKWRPIKISTPSLIPERKYRISFEIERLLWVSLKNANKYISGNLVEILKSIG